MSKYGIRPHFECQNRIFGPSSNVKIGFRMSKYDNRPDFECQNRVLNVEILHSAQFQGQNRI